MSYDNTEDMESGGHMKKSDLMGRFDFDGAEGIAFWIGDSDTEPIAKVMFDELETLKAFIEHNLPGMFGADGGTDELIAEARECAPGDCSTELAVMVHRLADALEATLGEPNDDREALAELVQRFEGYNNPDYLLADFLLSQGVGFSGAVVPDAATLQKAEAKIADLVYGNAKVVAERDAATEAIERVRAIHLEVGRQVDDAGVEYTVCKHCTEVNRYGQVRWPCPTRKALDGKEKNDE